MEEQNEQNTNEEQKELKFEGIAACLLKHAGVDSEGRLNLKNFVKEHPAVLLQRILKEKERGQLT